MPTATRKPSTELRRLEAVRDKTYAALQGVKRERSAYDQKTEGMRGEFSALVASRPEDHRDRAGNPKPGTPSAKYQAQLKARIRDGNPHERDYNLALEAFHAADEELQAFRNAHLVEVIAEQDSEIEALDTKRDKALGLLVECGEEYAGLLERVQSLVSDCPVLTGQHVAFDALPSQLKSTAEQALEHSTSAPTITELGRYRLEQHG